MDEGGGGEGKKNKRREWDVIWLEEEEREKQKRQQYIWDGDREGKWSQSECTPTIHHLLTSQMAIKWWTSLAKWIDDEESSSTLMNT